MKKLIACSFAAVFAIQFALSQTWTVSPSGCPGGPVLNKIIIDACTSQEGWNEFVTITNGSSPINANSIQMTGSTSGPPASSNFAADPAIAAQLNNMAMPACAPPVFVSPPGGIIPANAKVIAVVSNHGLTFTQNLSNLCGQGPIYVVSGDYTSSNGFFLNNPNASCPGAPAPCPKTITITVGGCTYSVTYDVRGFPGTDGSNVTLDPAGVATSRDGGNDCFPALPCTPPPPQSIALSPNGILCASVPKTITPSLTTTQIAGATYSWSGPAGYNSTAYNPPGVSLNLSAGTYTFSVTVTTGPGCSATATKDITVNGAPNYTAIPDITVCGGIPVPLAVVGTPPPPAGSTYQWVGPGLSSTSSPTPTATTPAPVIPNPFTTSSYSVTVTDPGGCKWSDNFDIIRYPPPATFQVTTPVNICPGQPINLTVTSGTVTVPIFGTIPLPTPFPFLAKFTWTGPSGYSSMTTNNTLPHTVVVNSAQAPTTPGSYTYSVVVGIANVSDNSCQSNPANVTVNVQAPQPMTFNTATLCAGNSLNLNNLISSPSPVPAGSWSGPGVTASPTFNGTALSSGTYNVTFTPSPSTCYLGGNTNIILSVPNAASTTQTGKLCGTSAPYSGSVDLSASSGFFYYKWSNGAMGNTVNSITVTNPGSYTVTITDLSGCTQLKSFTVTAGSVAPVSITAPANICSGFNSNLTLNNPYSSYQWNDGSSGPTLAINGPGTYSVTVTDPTGCTSTDTKTVNPGAQLTPTLSPVGKICGNGSVSLTVSSPFSTYSWSNGANTQSTTVTSAGVYSVTVSNAATGCTGSVSVTVSQFPSPTVSISGNNSFCPGSGTALTASPTSYNSYQWSNNQNTPGIFATQSGTFTLTVTDVNGCTASNSVIINGYPSPTPQINGVSAVCVGGKGNLSVSGGIFSAYLWSDGQTTASAILGSGTHTVTVTDLNGCKALATKIISDDPVNIAFTGSLNVCPQKNTTLGITGNYSSYKWSTGSNSPSITVGQGNYTITATNSNGCTGLAGVTINAYNQPVVNISGNASYCQGTNLTLATTPTFSSYSWSTGAVAATINASGTATYQVTVQDGNGCTATATKNITEFPNPKPNITGSTSICTGSSTLLDAGNVYNSYLWSTGETAKNIIISQVGTVSLTVTDARGCKGSDSKAITSNGNLVFSISGTPSFCNGKSTTLDAGAGFSTYIWDTGETTRTIQASSEKNYAVTVSNGLCTGSSSISVVRSPVPAFAILGDTLICDGASTVLSTSLPFSMYSWSNGDLNAGTTVAKAGNYSVTISDTNGCTATQTINVTVNPNPVPRITGNKAICPLDSVKISLTDPFSSYLWSDGSSTSSIYAKAGSTHTVTVTDMNGCKGIDNTTIPIQGNLNPKIDGVLSVCSGKSTTLSVQIFFDNYLWSTNETKNSIQVNTPGTYNITVSTSTGCSGTASVIVQQSSITPPTISGSDVICGRNSNTLSAGVGYQKYSWSTGAASQTITTSVPGNYKVTVTDLNGCTSSAGIDVIKVNTTGSLSDTLCHSEFRLVNGRRYDISRPEGVEILAKAANRGCDSTVNIKFYFRDSVSVTLSGPTSICSKLPVALKINVSGFAGVFDMVYGDDNGNTFTVKGINDGDTIIVSPQNTTTYRIISTSIPTGSCPPFLGTYKLSFGSLSLDAQVKNISCNGLTDGSILLSTIGLAPYTFVWSDGKNTGTIEGLPSGKYRVTVTDAIGCTASGEYEITEPKPLKILMVAQAASCLTGLGTITIQSIEGGSGKFTYDLDGSDKGDIPGIPYMIRNLSPGEHQVVIRESSNRNCNWTAKPNVADSDSIQVSLGPDITINYGDSVVITPATKFQMSKILWSPSKGLSCDTCQFPIAKPNVTRNYRVTVWDEEGCSASDIIQIIVNKVRRVYIPNTFSPNVDGNNDLIRIYLGDETVKVNFFRIYDRWGTLVYEDKNFTKAESQDEKRGWNGYYRGNLMNPAVFTYHAQVEFTDGEVKNYTGDIMLMKW